jgi:hypothetical protein
MARPGAVDEVAADQDGVGSGAQVEDRADGRGQGERRVAVSPADVDVGIAQLREESAQTFLTWS